MSSSTVKERMRLTSGVTVAAAAVLSGADLAQAALLTQASTTVGPEKDGARLEQLAAGGVT
jgi:hypothetical protein